MLSVIGQRLILNLKRFQARPPLITTRDVSREVDMQMAVIVLGDDNPGGLGPDRDLEANVNQVAVDPGSGRSASEYNGKTSPSHTRRAVTTGSNIEFVGTEVPCD